MDKIVIAGLQFYGYHGVGEEERRTGGYYQVDAEIYYDLSRAAESDSLSDTIDYGEVFRLLRRMGKQSQHYLLESLAEAMAAAVLDGFPARGVLIRLRKLNLPFDSQVTYVGVEIKRGQFA
jgi:7,8-dihydroneopterin aldolase/epimerase/oxygenase